MKQNEDEIRTSAIIAWGLCIMFILFGLGACSMLGRSKVEINYDNTIEVEQTTP